MSNSSDPRPSDFFNMTSISGVDAIFRDAISQRFNSPEFQDTVAALHKTGLVQGTEKKLALDVSINPDLGLTMAGNGNKGMDPSHSLFGKPDAGKGGPGHTA